MDTMTICVALAVPDGIALAADTQTTWHRTITSAKTTAGEMAELAEPIQVPIGWSKMARKLFPLKFDDRTFAVCTAGAASINQKTLHAVLKSAEAAYEGNGSYDEVLEHCKTAIWHEMKAESGQDDLSKAPFKIVELLLAGFEDGDVGKPILRVHRVFSGTLTIDGKPDATGYAAGWNNADQGGFGCCWIGRGEFVGHLVNHKNPSLPPIQGQYPMMTLADAQDYAQYLVEHTCDFQRFAVMVPDCGRPLVVSTLVPDRYDQKIV